MKAIAVIPGQENSIHMQDAPDPTPAANEALVRVLRVGLCGTDAEINSGLYGEAPAGSNYLILGHENFGVVESAGSEVKGIKPGDYHYRMFVVVGTLDDARRAFVELTNEFHP